jgi:ketosteroid isomerase-like protein
MRTFIHMSILLVLATSIACSESRDDFRSETIIALEQGALDRWGKGDPDGYFEIMAPDVSYFDPTTDERVDGKERLKAMIEPLRGKISIDRAEFLNPTVQRSGDVAVLTFNLISHGGRFDNSPKTDVRWNCTEVYRLIDGRWTITHTHWSFTKPRIAQTGGA